MIIIIHSNKIYDSDLCLPIDRQVPHNWYWMYHQCLSRILKKIFYIIIKKYKLFVGKTLLVKMHGFFSFIFIVLFVSLPSS